MAKLLSTKSLNYSDVNLIGQLGVVESRTSIANEPWRIIVSGMSSIIGPTFIKAASELLPSLQPTLHIPRDVFQRENLKLVTELGYPKSRVLVGVGIKNSQLSLLELKELGFGSLLIDVANGYMPQIKKRVEEIQEMGFIVAVGSVHSIEGFDYLQELGVNIVRTGIGPGSVCITADSTGYTRGTFTEVFELYNHRLYKDEHGFHVPDILADGGFYSTADFVKSFLAGADYCMSGGIFANVMEARMHSDGYERLPIPMHTYFGMASDLGKLCMGRNPIENIEGTYRKIGTEEVVTLKDLLINLWAGIRSGISYSGYSSLTDAIGYGVFEEKV